MPTAGLVLSSPFTPTERELQLAIGSFHDYRIREWAVSSRDVMKIGGVVVALITVALQSMLVVGLAVAGGAFIGTVGVRRHG